MAKDKIEHDFKKALMHEFGEFLESLPSSAAGYSYQRVDGGVFSLEVLKHVDDEI